MCSPKIEKYTDFFTNSDSESTMYANQTFNSILTQVQNSYLNFHLQISPFAAVISLKKTLVKDHDGVPLLPMKREDTSINKRDKSNDIERDYLALEEKFNDLEIEYTKACSKIEDLEMQVNTSRYKMMRIV